MTTSTHTHICALVQMWFNVQVEYLKPDFGYPLSLGIHFIAHVTPVLSAAFCLWCLLLRFVLLYVWTSEVHKRIVSTLLSTQFISINGNYHQLLSVRQSFYFYVNATETCLRLAECWQYNA